MSVSQLNAETFDSTVSEDKATLIDFFAEWCGPCKMQTPVLHKVADEYSSKMNFGAVNVRNSDGVYHSVRIRVQYIDCSIIPDGRKRKKAQAPRFSRDCGKQAIFSGRYGFNS